MILTWNGSVGFISSSAGNSALKVKPSFSFIYESVYYEPATNNAFYVDANGQNVKLDPDEIIEVEAFITGYDFSYLTKHYVDTNGKYVGYGIDDGITEVPSAPPQDGHYRWDGTAYVYVLAVDVNGVYLGNIEIDANTILVPTAPNTKHEIWNGNGWTDGRAVQDVIDEGKALIDEAAGKARLKYITDVSGQSETYAEKAKQAEAYSFEVSPVITDYPLVNAEYEAMVTGDNTKTPDDAAAYILATRDQWLVLAATIEELRRKGKVLLALETDSDSAVALTNTYIAQLGSV